MIILDTNVLSEEMRPNPSPVVHRWFQLQEPNTVYSTTVCRAEILAGIAVLQAGRRRTELEVLALRVFALFSNRLLPFDVLASDAYAEVIAERRKTGRPIGELDAQIAAIARSRGMALATRNRYDFDGLGLVIIDPWQTA